MKTLNFLILMAALFTSIPTHAAKVAGKFGDDDTIHKIQDVDIKSPKGDQLYLGYRTTTTYFILGVYLKKGGYVLADRHNTDNSYYPLSERMISDFQATGSLPKPMPKYELTIVDYLFGYSLWVLIFVIAAYYAIKGIVLKIANNIKQPRAYRS
jgi:hypothetical protein